MNKLKTYEAPSTRVAQVELRTNMLAGSIMEHKDSKVEASEHETGFDDVDGGHSFSIEGDWK
ncbi:MAG: hypothetical protein IJZ68_11560 [Bacteroidaceae bacterium]|nr:hypothetical protein [Bacteroidaceae bacterium]